MGRVVQCMTCIHKAHRRILGVVSVGSCGSQIQLNELCRLHESVKNKFVSTLFDSRLEEILFIGQV